LCAGRPGSSGPACLGAGTGLCSRWPGGGGRRHRWHRPGSGATTAAKHGTKASEASGGDGTLWKTNRPTRGFLTSGAVHAARDHAVISAHRTAAEKGSVHKTVVDVTPSARRKDRAPT